jgi:hypothetical protein
MLAIDIIIKEARSTMAVKSALARRPIRPIALYIDPGLYSNIYRELNKLSKTDPEFYALYHDYSYFMHEDVFLGAPIYTRVLRTDPARHPIYHGNEKKFDIVYEDIT